jgi:hypothetical protein
MYNIVALRAWGGRRHCGLRDGTSSMTLWALGHHGLWEDNGAAEPGMVRVDDVTCSGMAPGAQRHELEEDNVVVGSGTA